MSDNQPHHEMVWECGPHTNAWGGHDARCRQVPAEPAAAKVRVYAPGQPRSESLAELIGLDDTGAAVGAADRATVDRPCPDCGNDPADDTLHRWDCRRVLPHGHPLERMQFGAPWEPWTRECWAELEHARAGAAGGAR